MQIFLTHVEQTNGDRRPQAGKEYTNMKLTQNAIIHVLLGAVVLLAIALFYRTLAHYGRTKLGPLEWAVFGGAALALVLATFGPSLVRRWRRLPPPQPLSRSDIGFCIMVTLVGCAFTSAGGLYGMSWLIVVGIMLVPFSFILRTYLRQHDAQEVPTYKIMLVLMAVILLFTFLSLFPAGPARTLGKLGWRDKEVYGRIVSCDIPATRKDSRCSRSEVKMRLIFCGSSMIFRTLGRWSIGFIDWET